MPRRRMIDPNIWKDPEFAKLTDAQKVLFIGIISNADDEGRIIATPEALKADIFPYDHKKTAPVVKKLRDSVATTLKNEGGPEKTGAVLSTPPLKTGGDIEKTGAVLSTQTMKNVILYKNTGVEYIQLLKWYRYQKPKHLVPSRLPPPPEEVAAIEVKLTSELRQEIYERDSFTCQYCATDLRANPRQLTIDHVIPLEFGGKQVVSNMVTCCKSCNTRKNNRTPEQAGMHLIDQMVEQQMHQPMHQLIDQTVDLSGKDSSPRSGQSSLGKVSIGKVSAGKVSATPGVAEDFTGYLDSEKDLTDFLTTTLTKYIPRGPTFVMPVVCKLWAQARGQEMDKDVYPVLWSALQKYPLPVLAKSVVKAVKYSEGKHKPAKYIQTILQEQMKEYEKEAK